MADGAVNYLLHKLTTTLQQNASLIGDVHDEVEKIKLELESMKSFLKDAERRREKSESVDTWVRQVREVAIQVENILDEYLHYNDGTGTGKSGLKDFVQDAVNLPRRFTATRRMHSELMQIKVKVLEVSERSKRYGFDDRVDEDRRSSNFPRIWHHQHGESSAFADEDDIVGLDKEQTTLSEWLTGNEARRTVISVVGMGGLGKTTLVTKVYQDPLIKMHFECSAWISVSQDHEIKELLRNFVKEFFKMEQALVPGNLGLMNYRQLMEMLIEFLHCKRYLVVLDDIWSIDLWSKIRGAFPENHCGSRIVFTTRNENVATSVGPGSHVHKLKPLREDAAWTLFCKRTFWNEDGHSCPTELEALAKDILRKCEGLPLAIVAVAGLMCSKSKQAVEWKKVHASLNWQLSNNPILENVKGILMLSFNDLPFYLKYCFLYCCVFPEDYFIKRKNLIRLWIAEGFILERKGMTLEEVAEDHLMELILRSMIQVQQVNDNGRVKTFRVHDIMRELAMTTSEEESFCTKHDIHESKIAKNIQRLSINHRGEDVQLSRTTSRQLRSLFVFGSDMYSSSFSLNSVSSNFKFLRVLHLQKIPIERLPSALFDLFNLHHLNLRYSRIKDLPKAIEKLKNLQTLDLRSCNVEKLPRGISSLENLRHLFVGAEKGNDLSISRFHGLQIPGRIGNLQKLQSLACVEAEEGIIKKLRFLTELRRLDMTMLKASDGPNLCTSIQTMTNLHRLSLAVINKDEELLLENIQLAPPFLQKLELTGHLKRLPHWVASSAMSLTHLNLEFSGLEDNFLLALHKLPALVFLQLRKAYNGKFLQFKSEGFTNLHRLHLVELQQLNSVEFEEGSLRSLKEVSLMHCVALELLPRGLEHITSLQKMHLKDMPKLIGSLQTDGSEYFKVEQQMNSVTLVF